LTFASLTRVLTTREQAALGGESAWGLVPEERMGTTVRRTADQRILIRNTVRYRADAMITDTCRSRARQIHERAFLARFPMLGEIGFEYTWGGVLGVSLNGAHFFGQLADNLFATAGYNGVGVAMGTVAGTLLADLAVGADSDLLRDMLALPKPAWIPPEPLLGWAVRPALAWLAARAREEI
jgi:glycine/D-amino acid oxidase-like deaminating enzyme